MPGLACSLHACLRVLAIAGACVSINACSYQAWYTGMQESQRQECYKSSPNESVLRQCLERVNDMDYEDYERARRGGAGEFR